MAHFDLVCKDCDHSFVVVTRSAIREKQKRCPECGSENVRQTLSSYLQNGPLSSPTCGEPQRSSGYG
jgi:putative FmdB family regulatory protein